MPPLTIAALLSELRTDPANLGYSQYMASGVDGTPEYLLLTNMLNDPGRNSPQGGPAFPVPLGAIDTGSAVAFLDGGEFHALDQGDQNYLILLSASGTLLLKDPTDPSGATDTPAFTHLKAIFPAGSASRAAMDRLTMRAGTRAEALFGPHTSVSVAQVTQALTSP
jgi:hypothetical protein